ncbi:hypothetical protein NHH82_12290 [Oxalobacteraceae bacterium OTU3REALA1]|nr:hypothetical protein NHH82_12290 [Oxalobacteraceae bacterium OTU3REALA1]
MTTSKNMPNGWTRPAVTFRLTPRRRQDLLALCGEDADSLTPTAALDLAIALARDTLRKDAKKSDADVTSSTSFDNPETSGVLLGGDLSRGMDRHGFDELSAQLREERQEFRDFLAAHTSRSGEILAAIAGQIKELRDVITTAAIESDVGSDGDNIEKKQQSNGRGQDFMTPVLMRDWLEREAAELPRPGFVLKAQWQTSRRGPSDSVLIELLVQRVATAGVEGQLGRGIQGFVHLSVSTQEEAAALTSPMPFYFRCQCDAHKVWRLSLHQMADGTQLGAPLLTLRL